MVPVPYRQRGIIVLLVIVIIIQQVIFMASRPPDLELDEKSVLLKPKSSTSKSHQTLKKKLDSQAEFNVVKPFNRTNPYTRSWCPKATCNNSPLCTPCNRRYLFIIATGRSGSTTLLKMFNQLPNVRLSGENWNILYHASSLIKVFENNPRNFLDKETVRQGKFMHEAIHDGPFLHNAMPLGSISCVMQGLVRYLDPPLLDPETFDFDVEDESTKILGAKVIRLQQSQWTTKRAFKFLTQSFPCARYIINTRSDYIEQGKSMMNAFGKVNIDENIEDILKQTQFLRELSERLGSKRAKLIDMVEWTGNVSILNEVLDWLGFENCAFSSVIHENHDRFGHDDTTLSLGKKCRYPYI